MDAVNPLNYAPKPPVAARISRWLYRLVFAGAIAAAFVFWGPGLWRWGNFLYWQHCCLIYWQPPTHVVRETSNFTIIHPELCPPLNSMQRYLEDGTADDGTIFLHEIQTPSGSRRLVLLSLSASHPQIIASPLEFGCVQWSATPHERLLSCNSIEMPDLAGPFISPRHWKFFAGQPDLSNPSHFTFDFELDGARHTCDAWLKDDGELIVSQRP